jgi:glyoxylase-like metal-dependent hydrolase (beta-lactamase superfamily II)
VAAAVVRIDAPLPLRSPTQINCYLLRDALSAGDLLVDTGMRESRAAIDAELRLAGLATDWRDHLRLTFCPV